MNNRPAPEPTQEKAIATIEKLRRHAPYRFGGKWFLLETATGWQFYRTRKAALRNATGTDLFLIE